MKKLKKQLTLNRLNRTNFDKLYENLLIGRYISNEEKVKLLSIAIVLINQDDKNLQRLGYRIVLMYSYKYNDYKPLYDVAINNGLIPVVMLIKNIINITREKEIDSFFDTFISSYIDNFKNENIFFTEQQLLLNKFFEEKLNDSLAIIAPTSYGKSELIISLLKESFNKKICILVPTKSLLSQTKKRVLNARISWISKIVTHPEMYNPNDDSAIFILTQERLSRLLNVNKELFFDIIFVDEAHNLLSNDTRNILLASLICILEYRNKSTAFKFLTPFLMDANNLKIKYTKYNLHSYSIDEYVKSEIIYLVDFRDKAKLSIYDQFLNREFEAKLEYSNHIDFIKNSSSNKNIIYINSPKKLQIFATELAKNLPYVECPLIKEACNELSSNINIEYNLIDCLKKGVIYHHGSVPDTIRLYIEYLFDKSSSLKYLVSSSTLLEGVNLPIEKLFLLDYKKGRSNLTPSQFKNLIGRANRFSDVFNKIDINSLKKLTPSIYVIATEQFTPKINLFDFINKAMNVKKVVNDDVSNELLCTIEITEKNEFAFKEAIGQLENLENGIIDSYSENYVKTNIGKLLIAHNVREINIFESEERIQKKLDSFLDKKIIINDVNTLIKFIADCFVNEITKDNGLSRLKEEAAQKYYAMYLNWKVENLSLNEIIKRVVYYWNSLSDNAHSTIVFVGKWGDRVLNPEQGFREHYTDISRKNDKEKINLAIVRVKEEDDFIDNVIFKFIDIIHDSNLIDSSFFKKIKYGTDNDQRISLIKNGLSLGLSELLLKRYLPYLDIENDGNINLKRSLISEMKKNKESPLTIFEASMNTTN